MTRSLIHYRRNYYSQNGEDGVLAELLRRLDISTGWFCEFGAWDGKYGSNTFPLVKQGWFGVEIESNTERFQDLLRTMKPYQSHIYPIHATVSEHGPSSLNNLLAQTPIPVNFEVLSIDVDGPDWHLWHSLTVYRPLIVIIEIDSSIPPEIEHIHTARRPMSSFTSTLQLGIRKGYTLVCHTGNMIFVRQDLTSRLNLPRRHLTYPEELFLRDWVCPNHLQTWKRKIRNVSIPRVEAKSVIVTRGATRQLEVLIKRARGR